MDSKLIIYTYEDRTTLIPNYNFEGNISGWSTSGYWAWGNNNYIYATQQSNFTYTKVVNIFHALTNLKKYRLSYNISGFVSDNLRCHYCAIDGNKSKLFYTNGHFEAELYCTNSFDIGFYFPHGVNAGCRIYDIGIEEVIENELELGDDFYVALSFSIAEIQDISQRNTPYSKSLIIPGTKLNNKVFKSAYNLSTLVNFDMNVPIKCIYYNENIPLFAGFLYLNTINTSNNDTFIEYECTIVSGLKSFFDTLSSKLLTGNENSDDNIDLSEWNHILNNENIINSWWKGTDFSQFVGGFQTLLPNYPSTNNQLGKGYVYPLIDYGYVSEFDTTYNFEMVKVDNFTMRPSIFVSEIFEKIFQYNNFEYVSTFLNSDLFKRLIMPATSEMTITQDIVDLRTADWTNNTTYTGGILHPCNNINTTSGIINLNNGAQYATIPNPGIYNIDISIDNLMIGMNRRVVGNNPSDNIVRMKEPETACLIKIKLIRLNSLNTSVYEELGEGETYLNDGDLYYNPVTDRREFPLPDYPQSQYFRTKTNIVFKGSRNGEYNIDLITGDILQLLCIFESEDYTDASVYNFEQGAFFNFATNKVFIEPIFLAQGVYFCPYMYDYTNYTVPDLQGTVMTIAPAVGSQIREGDIVSINQVLPLKTQSEFLNSIFRTFNLYIDVDKQDPKKFYIEPRDTYYDDFEELDWSDKKDDNSIFKIIEPDLKQKNLRFSYSEDDDNLNKYYQDYTKKVYGELNIKSQIDTDQVIETELIFSPSPIKDFVSPINKLNVITPYIYKTDNQVVVNSDFNPRLLYWGGLKKHYGDISGWYLRGSTSKAYVLDENFYPYAGHVDSPHGDSTLDLNFNWSYWKYWDNFNFNTQTYESVTPNNLYNVYYNRMINELLNSRIVTCYLNLTNLDIYNLNFRNKIIIDGIHYHINKINDWVSGELTEVELIKIVSILFEATTELVYNQPFVNLVTPNNPLNLVQVDNVVETELPSNNPTTTARYRQNSSTINIDVIDGDCLPFSDIIINVVNGGLDAVREYGSSSPTNYIDSDI